MCEQSQGKDEGWEQIVGGWVREGLLLAQSLLEDF